MQHNKLQLYQHIWDFITIRIAQIWSQNPKRFTGRQRIKTWGDIKVLNATEMLTDMQFYVELVQLLH